MSIWSTGTDIYSWLEFKDVIATIEVSVAVPLKAGNQSYSYTTLEPIFKDLLILLQRHLLDHVHYYFIYDIQKLDTDNLNVNKWMGKETVVCS